MGFKRIVAKSEQDMKDILEDVKEWFKENKILKPSFTSEKRKFMDPETKKIVEKDIEVINIVDQNNGKETSIKFIPLLKPGEMKIEIGGDNESTVIGKIKNQLKNRGVLKSYTKDTKKPLNEDIRIKKLVKEVLSEQESKMDKYYSQILELIRKAARDLNDSDAYKLHEKLKTWFNKII